MRKNKKKIKIKKNVIRVIFGKINFFIKKKKKNFPQNKVNCMYINMKSFLFKLVVDDPLVAHFCFVSFSLKHGVNLHSCWPGSLFLLEELKFA